MKSDLLMKIFAVVLLIAVLLPLVEWFYFANGERKNRGFILTLALSVLIVVIILFVLSDQPLSGSKAAGEGEMRGRSSDTKAASTGAGNIYQIRSVF